ncbi:hypothetical protein OGATHE_003823 [Ogataea polymorpha]|uniref:Uncharacterized protein n=1 Tax=Ogataea polymorpha TaxID=460523 RepID=A0A9P8P3Q7_9ASCO|nr:hypothetical protein OGATHE_003823 [Ogataea polymorpha]
MIDDLFVKSFVSFGVVPRSCTRSLYSWLTNIKLGPYLILMMSSLKCQLSSLGRVSLSSSLISSFKNRFVSFLRNCAFGMGGTRELEFGTRRLAAINNRLIRNSHIWNTSCKEISKLERFGDNMINLQYEAMVRYVSRGFLYEFRANSSEGTSFDSSPSRFCTSRIKLSGETGVLRSSS